LAFRTQTSLRGNFRSHTTLAGRVVYDRRKHEFTTRDLVRISKSIKTTDLVELFDLNLVILELLVSNLTLICNLLGYGVAFNRLYPFVRRVIADVWLALTNNSATPPAAQGGIKLQGGLSLL
jgi:hypothetical protein